MVCCILGLKNYQCSTEGQKSHEHSAPWGTGNTRKIITSAAFTVRPDVSAPVVAIAQSSSIEAYNKSGLSRFIAYSCGSEGLWAKTRTKPRYYRERGKSCFSNRALVEAIFEAPKCL